MTINTQDMIGSILESISRIDYIKPEDIPNINLENCIKISQTFDCIAVVFSKIRCNRN